MIKSAAVSVGVAVVILAMANPAVARGRVKSDTVLADVGSAPVTNGVSDRQRYCIVETPTGSHIARKTCKTRAEWLAQDSFDPTAK